MDANLIEARHAKASAVERAAILSAEIRKRLGNEQAIMWGEALMKSPEWSIDLYIAQAEQLIVLLDADESLDAPDEYQWNQIRKGQITWQTS